ncbi:oligosaccharide flippase family protein [Thermaurantiacus sp.]
MALGFLVGVQLARYLGAEQFGVYGYVMSIVSVAAIAGSVGVQVLSMREVAIAVTRKDWALLAGFARWALSVVFPISLLATGGGILWLFLVSSSVALDVVAIIPLMVLGLVGVAISGAMLRGLGQLLLGQSLDVLVQPALQCVLIFSVFQALGGLRVEQALTLTAIATCCTAALGLLWLKRDWPMRARGVARRTEAGAWRRAALPMWATTILFVLDAQAPILIFGLFAEAAQLGNFRVAVGSLVFVALPYALVTGFLPPLAARMQAEGDPAGLQRLASASALACFIPTLMIFLLLLVAGEPLIDLVFGAEYGAAWLPLMIMAAGSLFRAAMGIPATFLQAACHERVVTLAFALGLILLVALLFLLAPRHGDAGAAAAVVGAMVARDGFLAVVCRLRTGTHTSLMAVGRALAPRYDA